MDKPTEYIKREDAIAQEEIIVTNTGREVCAVRTHKLQAIPAADVVERSDDLVRVVRCGECENAQLDDGATELRCKYLRTCRTGSGSIVKRNDACRLPIRMKRSESERMGGDAHD